MRKKLSAIFPCRVNRRLVAFAAAVAVLTSAVVVAAAEPAGLDKAKLKMSVEEFRAAYPKAEVLEKSLGAAVVGGPYVKRYVIWKQEVPGLSKPSDVEYRFWEDKLWVIIAYFPEEDPDAVATMLKKQLGSEGRGDGASLAWIGDKTTTVWIRREKYYSISDNDLAEDARAVLFQGLRRGSVPQGTAPSGSSSAGATPASSPVPSAGVPPPTAKSAAAR